MKVGSPKRRKLQQSRYAIDMRSEDDRGAFSRLVDEDDGEDEREMARTRTPKANHTFKSERGSRAKSHKVMREGTIRRSSIIQETFENGASTGHYVLEPVVGHLGCGFNHFQLFGYVARGYEPVLFQFKQDAQRGIVHDSQVCAYVRGEVVVDLCIRKEHVGSSYSPASVQVIMSSGKSIASLVVAQMAEKGYLQYDQLVSDLWPEYGCNGKESTTIAHVMRHEAGLAHVTHAMVPFSALTTQAIKAGASSALLEKLTPSSEPGKEVKRASHHMSMASACPPPCG
jgi:hypothetical protein